MFNNLFNFTSSGIVQKGALLNYYQYVNSVLGDNLLMYFRLNEESGNVLDSLSIAEGIPYASTYQSAAPYASEKSVYLSDLTVSRIDLYSSTFNNLFPNSQGSISFWIKPTTDMWDGATRTLLIFRSTFLRYFALRFGSADSISLTVKGNVSTQSAYTPYMRSEAWQLITLAWDEVSNEVDYFVNAIKIASVSGVGLLPENVTSGYSLIGNEPTAYNRAAKSQLSNIMFFNKRLEETDVRDLISGFSGYHVFEGDSRTSSYSLNGTVMNYTTEKTSTRSNAVAGGTTMDLINRGADVDNMFIDGYTNRLNVFCGVNDYATLTATEIYNNLRAYCLARKSKGYEVIICTEIAASVAGWDVKYLELNTLISNNYTEFADKLADLGGDARLQDFTDTNYYLGDGVHPTYEAVKVMAEIIANATY